MSQPKRRASLAIWVLVGVLAYLIPRAAFLTADPPVRMPNGAPGIELCVEPPAKAYEARTRALFGAWRTNEADNYRYWRIQSPVWVYPLAGWFKAFGVSYASLRSFSIVGALLGFAGVLAITARRLTPFGRAAVVGFWALSFYDIQYQRVGLLETGLSTAMVATVFCLDRAHSRAGPEGPGAGSSLAWLFAATWAVAAGCLIKQTMLLFAPILLVVGIPILVKARREGRITRAWIALLAVHGLVIAAILVAYALQDDYLNKALRNLDHMTERPNPRSFSEEDLAIGGTTGARLLFRGPLSTMPLTFPLALIQGIRVLRTLARRRARTWELAVVAWFAATVSTIAFPHVDLRFQLPQQAPSALLAAALVADLARAAAARWGPRRALPIGAGLLGAVIAVVEAPRYLDWHAGRTYSVANAERQFGETLDAWTRAYSEREGQSGGAEPKTPVVIGAWAPMVFFGTRAQFYYVRREFNASQRALSDLGITHFLRSSTNDFVAIVVRRPFPKLDDRITPVETADVMDRSVTLCEMTTPF